jgi:hypothetical protein
VEVKVKLWGIQELLPAFKGKDEVSVDFDGEIVKDLILYLFSNIESKKKGILFNDKGKMSSQVILILNGKIVSDWNRLNRRLRGGDFIELVLAPG